MLGLIRDAWDRVVRFFSGREGPGGGKGPAPARDTVSPVPAAGTAFAPGSVPGQPDREAVRVNGAGGEKPGTGPALVPGSVPGPGEHGPISARGSRSPALEKSCTPVPGNRAAVSRWDVKECRVSPFEKCGRVFITGDSLVVRTDLDTRGFCIPLADLDRALAGEGVPILVLSTGEPAGIAARSALGRAVNFRVGTILYTVPVAKVRDVREGRARKAAVFVGKGG